MASSMPLRAPSVTLFMSGSSTYSLLMRDTTSLNTPMCLSVSSGDLLWPSTLPIRSRTVRHEDALTTKYFVRLLIGFSTAPALQPLYRFDAPAEGLVLGLFPAVSLAQGGDMGGMVPPVPGVERQIGVQAYQTEFGMAERAGEIGVAEGFEQQGPAGVQAFDELQGWLHGAGARIGQFRPGLLIVGADSGLRLGERQAQADIAVHVAVGDVVDSLADGPTAGPVWGIELRIVQAADGIAEKRRGGGD